jgi:hypothetical protein
MPYLYNLCHLWITPSSHITWSTFDTADRKPLDEILLGAEV